MLNERAKKYGWQIFARVLDRNTYPEYSNVTYSHRDTIKEDFADFCKKWKPKKICNYIDYLTWWEAVDYDCEHIYFVRSCYAEVIERTQQPVKEEWLLKENLWIRSADKVIVACPESQKAVKKHYNIDAEIVLEYVNPEKYHNVPFVPFKQKGYYVGRFDKQKRFNLIKPVDGWDVVGIGRHELDDEKYLSMETHGTMAFEEYLPFVKDATFGLYPAIWESNGYSVQECLSMGKIPIIQNGSGGHERLCNPNNSISIEWTEQNWWEEALDKYDPTMHDAARSALTQKMYEDSLEKFVEILHS
jgi:glycosyltransferase involved in cell wall biosynthesis